MKTQKLMKTGIFSVVAALLAFNGSASATLLGGGKTTAIKNAYYTSSVFTYGYQGMFDEGKDAWAKLSSKVKITWVSSDSGLPDKYYVGNTATANLIGLMSPYKYASDGVNFVPASVYTDTWAYCNVSAYDNQIKAQNNNQGLSRPQIVSSVTTHEVGHSLSLDHSPTGVTSVMTANAITDFAPTTYDKNDIVSKWGS